MDIVDQVEHELTTRGHRFVKEFTSGNYDDRGVPISQKVPTLTTRWCEIGFYGPVVYFVFVVRSDSWSSTSFDVIKKLDVQIYGFNDFTKNYDLDNDPEQAIKSEPFFQVQFNRDRNVCTASELANEYEQLIDVFRSGHLVVVDQLGTT